MKRVNEWYPSLTGWGLLVTLHIYVLVWEKFNSKDRIKWLNIRLIINLMTWMKNLPFSYSRIINVCRCGCVCPRVCTVTAQLQRGLPEQVNNLQSDFHFSRRLWVDLGGSDNHHGDLWACVGLWCTVWSPASRRNTGGMLQRSSITANSKAQTLQK